MPTGRPPSLCHVIHRLHCLTPPTTAKPVSACFAPVGRRTDLPVARAYGRWLGHLAAAPVLRRVACRSRCSLEAEEQRLNSSSAPCQGKIVPLEAAAMMARQAARGRLCAGAACLLFLVALARCTASYWASPTELRSLTNGLPSRTNVCTRRKRTCGPQGGSPGLTEDGHWKRMRSYRAASSVVISHERLLGS